MWSPFVLLYCRKYWVNSLAPGACGSNVKSMIFKFIIQNSGMRITFRWMPHNLINEKSTLVQVMAWCSEATSHYLIQCWPNSLLLFCINRPQWVKLGHVMTARHYYFLNTLNPEQNGCHFADDIFKCNILNEKFRILIKILLKLVPKDPTVNHSTLVQVMA